MMFVDAVSLTLLLQPRSRAAELFDQIREMDKRPAAETTSSADKRPRFSEPERMEVEEPSRTESPKAFDGGGLLRTASPLVGVSISRERSPLVSDVLAGQSTSTGEVTVKERDKEKKHKDKDRDKDRDGHSKVHKDKKKKKKKHKHKHKHKHHHSDREKESRSERDDHHSSMVSDEASNMSPKSDSN